MKRLGVALILLLAFCGLADSAYLAQNESAGTPLICTVKGLTDCGVVAASAYSRFLGVPIAYYGMFFYGALFALAALELVLFDRLLRRALQALALAGITASLYFVFVQVAFIKALCIYCVASALLALLIFVLAGFIEPVRRRTSSPRLPMPGGVTLS